MIDLAREKREEVLFLGVATSDPSSEVTIRCPFCLTWNQRVGIKGTSCRRCSKRLRPEYSASYRDLVLLALPKLLLNANAEIVCRHCRAVKKWLFGTRPPWICDCGCAAYNVVERELSQTPVKIRAVQTIACPRCTGRIYIRVEDTIRNVLLCPDCRYLVPVVAESPAAGMIPETEARKTIYVDSEGWSQCPYCFSSYGHVIKGSMATCYDCGRNFSVKRS